MSDLLEHEGVKRVCKALATGYAIGGVGPVVGALIGGGLYRLVASRLLKI